MASSLELRAKRFILSNQVKYTSLAGLVTTLIALIVLAQNYYKYASVTEGYSVKLSLIYNLIVYATYALTTPLILRFTDKIKLREGKWYGKFAAHLGLSIALALVHMLFCNLFLYAIDLSSTPVFDRFITKYLTNVIHIHLLIYWATVLLITFYRDLYPAATKEAHSEANQNHWARFTIKENGRIFHLDFKDVYWIEAQDHYQKLHTARGYHMIKSSMKNLEEHLPNHTFRRAHRSYFVNIKHVSSRLRFSEGRKGDFLELDNGLSLRLGKAFRSRFEE